ncbi:hypothetical protein [Anoxybacter fermentans]|uniref:hypothetical protein n=1 Tax=Anoxybacter fermentans TaxID=1323375 RepID=UPI000F8D22B5|nr:hypothetical protein [Anoxybacter fermentans]
MKVYNQSSNQTRRFDNEASKCKSKKSGFKLKTFSRKFYPIYKNPIKTYLKQNNSGPSVAVNRNIINLKKSEVAINFYLNQMRMNFQTLNWENNFERVVEAYKKQRKEAIRSHEKKLWENFNPKHMIYIDNKDVGLILANESSGQIIDFLV